MTNIHFPRINERPCNQPAAGVIFFISPGVAIVCPATTYPLTAYTNDGTADTVVSDGITWASSDTAIATVDAMGIVTYVADGNVVISAVRNGQTAYAYLSLFVAGTCCDDLAVGTVLLVDRSPSMLADFSPSFATAFGAAKAIASLLASELDELKDFMAVEEFDGAPQLIAPLGNVKVDLTNALAAMSRSDAIEERTDILAAIVLAMKTLGQNTTIGKSVMVVISDGIVQPEPGSQDLGDILMVVEQFKDFGGIVICVGMNATGNGYLLLRNIATPGYFVNVLTTTAAVSTAVTTLLALRARYCANG